MSEQPVPSVWARPPRQREQQALSRDEIVAKALVLLDADGIEALSMRKLGTKLGAAATSLYRHVANKDELLELVVDEVWGEIDIPAADGPDGWRAAAERGGHSVRAMVLRHPWVVSVIGQAGLISLGPNVLELSERLLTVLASAGFDVVEADRAMNTLLAYVIGMATTEAAYLSMLARSGRDETELLTSLRPTTEHAMRDHPRLREGYAAMADRHPRDVREENFDYGLQRVLDGLATRLG